MDMKTLLVYVVLFAFGILLFIVIQQAVSTTDMSVWTFEGHEGIASFLTVFPYIFLLAVILTPVYMIVEKKP